MKLKVKLPSVSLDNFIVLVIINMIVMLNAVLSIIIITVEIHMIGNQQPSLILKTAAMNHISLVLNINWFVKSMMLDLNILMSVVNILILVTMLIMDTMIIITNITNIIAKTKNLLIKWAIKNIKNILDMLIIAITLKLKLKNYKTIVTICSYHTHLVNIIIQYDPKQFLFKFKIFNSFKALLIFLISL